MSAVERSTGYGLTISRSQTDKGWVRVWLRKQFWSVQQGTRSRLVAETGFYAQGMSERDILEGALREMLRALADDVA
jgi:hypothetical protein